MARNSGNLDCKVYIGDLGYGAAKQDLEEVFSKYGPLTSVWVARNPPGFAFVEFEDKRDADDAIHGADGTRINGRTVRVEPCSGKTRQGRGGGGGGGGGGYRRGGGRPQYGGGRSNYNRDRSRSRSPQRRYRSRSRSPAERKRRDSRSPAKDTSSKRDWS